MNRSRLLLVIFALACQSKAASVADTTVVDTAPTNSVSVVRPAVMLACGENEVTLWYDSDSTVAIIDGERLTLRRVVTDSMRREVATTDSTVYIVRHDSATSVHVRGRALPECVQQSEHPFEGRGHEPGWVLRIIGDRITYIGNYGADTVATSVASVTTSGSATTYITPPSTQLTVVVSDEPCADGATGMPHPYKVTVTHDATTVNGCGGEPSSLLVGQTWTVFEIRGAPITESPPTMTFTRSQRVGGTTSCNRYSGLYRLSGEGLSFGAMISTKMACAEPRMSQETTFLSALATVARFEIAADGSLRLQADNGQAIVARRQ